MRLGEAKRLPFHIQQQFTSNVLSPDIHPYKFVLELNETEGTNSTTSIVGNIPGSVAVALALHRSPSSNPAAWIHQRIRIWVWKWLLPVSSKNSIVNFRLTHSGSLEIIRQYISYPIGSDFLIICPRRTDKIIRTVFAPRLVTVPYNSHRFL